MAIRARSRRSAPRRLRRRGGGKRRRDVYVTDYGNKQVVTTGGRGDATFAVFLVKPIESGRI
jgi:hypothetical protein